MSDPSPPSNTPPPVRASIRQWLFGRMWRITSGPVNRTLAESKRSLFDNVPEELVEIGPGIGANFEHYGSGTIVHAHEPNPVMHGKLQEVAEEHGIVLHISPADVRSAAIPPGSVDAVVSTLVLCSVDDPSGLVDEIHSILRPGGRFYFHEHIAPEPGTAPAAIAKMIRRPWAAFGDHCDVMARTKDIIQAAGFTKIDARVEPFGGRLDPSSNHYWGIAFK